MLKSKSILAPKAPDDGQRISIMSRHTESDGVTPDKQITRDRYDEHMPEFAVPAKIVGAYYREEIDFEQLGSKYLEYLPSQRDKIIEILKKAENENITVMCIEDTPDRCHRRLFIEFSTNLAETLNIDLKTEVK